MWYSTVVMFLHKWTMWNQSNNDKETSKPKELAAQTPHNNLEFIFKDFYSLTWK